MKIYRLIAACLVVIILAGTLASCKTIEFGIEVVPTPNSSFSATLTAFQDINNRLGTQIATHPTLAPSLTPAPTLPQSTSAPNPSPSPTEVLPNFSQLHFTNNPDSPEARLFYVAGIQRVNAVWNYADMSSDAVIKRVWYFNDKEWATKEEPWNYSKYGASGTMKDISQFDYNTGLQAGKYSLSLYINNVLQDVGDGVVPQQIASFWVFPAEVTDPVTSPDRATTAYVKNGGRLLIEGPDGTTREMVSTDEIANVTWFPDSTHLLYVERDRSKQVNEKEDWGITHKLWILDVETGEQHLIGAAGENFHTPRISPNGKYIAVLAGDTFTDRCNVSPSVAIIELNNDLQRSAVYHVQDFTGLPFEDSDKYTIYPRNLSKPGDWDNDNRFIASLGWSCLTANTNPAGHYRLDLDSKEATRTGD